MKMGLPPQTLLSFFYKKKKQKNGVGRHDFQRQGGRGSWKSALRDTMTLRSAIKDKPLRGACQKKTNSRFFSSVILDSRPWSW